MDGESGELTGSWAWTGKSETEGLEWGWRRELGSWFQSQGEAYQKDRSVIRSEDDVGGRVRVTRDEERMLRGGWNSGLGLQIPICTFPGGGGKCPPPLPMPDGARAKLFVLVNDFTACTTVYCWFSMQSLAVIELIFVQFVQPVTLKVWRSIWRLLTCYRLLTFVYKNRQFVSIYSKCYTTIT